VILLCGKGHEEYEIMPDGTHPFSEREIVQAAAARHLRSKGFY
jgi:UDP-N-acetylmuramyl tripeptide synthase